MVHLVVLLVAAAFQVAGEVNVSYNVLRSNNSSRTAIIPSSFKESNSGEFIVILPNSSSAASDEYHMSTFNTTRIQHPSQPSLSTLESSSTEEPNSIHSAPILMPLSSTEHQSTSNSSSTTTEVTTESFVLTTGSIALALTLLLLILATVIGNLFVITAILIERNLRTIGNSLVFSLAVADLMVACLVMPIAAVQEVRGAWTFGALLCDMWTSLDVLSCTASILHLVAIALDRFWAVTNVEYIHSRTPSSVGGMISCVWIVALVISVAPILGWKDDDFMVRIEQDKTCMISQDVWYQVLATVTTFYAPLVVILLLYWRIFKVARKRLRNKPGSSQHQPPSVKSSKETEIMTTPSVVVTTSTTIKKNSHKKTNKKDQCNNREECQVKDKPTLTLDTNNLQALEVQTSNDFVSNGSGRRTRGGEEGQNREVMGSKRILSNEKIKRLLFDEGNTKRKKEKNSQEDEQIDAVGSSESPTDPSQNPVSSVTSIQYHQPQQQPTPTTTSAIRTMKDIRKEKERKAAKTLAIITGVFIVCWLPFFVLVFLTAVVLDPHSVSKKLSAVFLWLGYVNSLLNPVIYTIFSPDFRNSFKRMLPCQRKTVSNASTSGRATRKAFA